MEMQKSILVSYQEKPLSYLTMNDGHQLAYRRFGCEPGSAPVLVLLHGWACHSLFFGLMFEHLGAKYDVIIPDQRGHGFSAATSQLPVIEDLATDLNELIEQLQLTQVRLAGWSMGATVAFQYMQEFGMERLAGLAIIDMTPKAMNSADWQLGIRDGYNEDNAKATLDSICRDWQAHSQHFPFALLNTDAESSLAEWIIDEVSDNSADSMASLWQSLIGKDYRQLLPHIAIPCIIIAGGDSPLYELATADYLAAQLPDARLKVLAGCGHGPPMQQPQQCADKLCLL